MIENIILGAIQGVAEWLPVSSEGLIFLAKANFFPGGGFDETLKQALFFHFGTFLAALVYFRKEVAELLKTLFNYKAAGLESRKILNFLFLTTLISGILGFAIYELTGDIDSDNLSAQYITLLVGVLLLITAFLQYKSKKINSESLKNFKEIKNTDSVILGLTQAAAVFPGLSRSGLTVSALLLLKFKEANALKLSFLMSLPIVFIGNIVLNLNESSFNLENLVGLTVSFVFGLITIKFLLKLAEKINFAFFVLIFAIITIAAAFI